MGLENVDVCTLVAVISEMMQAMHSVSSKYYRKLHLANQMLPSAADYQKCPKSRSEHRGIWLSVLDPTACIQLK